MEKYLTELEAIAKEACDIGLHEVGQGWEYLTPNIRVYNADNSDHQAADIFKVNVALFSTPEFTIKISHIKKLKDYVALARIELEVYKNELKSRDTKKLEAEKNARIANLQKELERLTGPTDKKG